MQNIYQSFFVHVSKRYGLQDMQALETVLSPLLVPIASLDKTIQKLPGQSHFRASFTVAITAETQEVLQVGRTGKFVPKPYVVGSGIWNEIAKGRIVSLDLTNCVANGEVYVGGSRSELQAALVRLQADDYLEIDQYGASAKVLSSLVEYSFAKLAKAAGYVVRRMPEDTARHLGTYYNYDFELEKNGISKKVEVKSLWGTNTRYARLIHSKGRDYPTSSCKFDTQDIFAVSLFLRTGNIEDFAFAASVWEGAKPFGLPCATGYQEHVHQNPVCELGNGSWYATIDEVWSLL